MEKQIEALKKELASYGVVEQCEEKDGKFIVHLTECSARAKKVVSLGFLILNHVDFKYPVLDSCDNKTGSFRLVLKKRSENG